MERVSLSLSARVAKSSIYFCEKYVNHVAQELASETAFPVYGRVIFIRGLTVLHLRLNVKYSSMLRTSHPRLQNAKLLR